MFFLSFKIGTLADWFGVGLLEGIRKSQAVGATGVQIYAWNELDPRTITPAEVKKIRQTARDCGQTVTALCGELGGHGLEVAADNLAKIEYLKATLRLAQELDCSIVTTHIGVVPRDKTDPKYAVLQDACGELSEFALKNGGRFAVETGPEIISVLAPFLRECGPGMAINYDPANLVMVTGDDEVQGVHTAGSLIAHTHAKDGYCNVKTTPEHFYGIFANGGIEALQETQYGIETPIGKGAVRWAEYLTALHAIGYNGYLTIEREVKENVEADIRGAVVFLTELMEKLKI